MHNKIKGKVMNENNMLLIIVLLSSLLVIPFAFAEVPAPQGVSQPLLNKPSEAVKITSTANEEIKTQKKRVKTEPVKPVKPEEAENNDRFNPTETISEDLSVSFPTDI